uniref:Septum site-determining protein n=1 Tax=Entransia fimbriata TaxID=130991 RepID=A0A191T4N4_9VIRI|nr:septum site-determining protein [Entransia fimbriata]YP_009256733.1 septum site-determining protein [Entransia fimbriata]ANI25356.1 septum site-determining protein [Entransia fimbriata]ANI25457.1 septum site-determining protein [Entransia fimbriata]WKT05739.1 septum-site determining protein [Entransia fimbriata]WKT05740.1 septum-site determining protein [Entransia fimbriata]WKT05858.1 septum-site determining protein [Entransia fimbriata]
MFTTFFFYALFNHFSLDVLVAGQEIPQPFTLNKQAQVIVITSGKGGVGKTTTTANLGMCLARSNYKVVLIDADIGLRNLDLLLGLENRVLYTAMDILNGICRLDQALISDKRWNNLSVLCISKNRQKQNLNRSQMVMLVDALKPIYDFVLIDCPAGIDVGFFNAVGPAQEAIIVTTPEITSIRDADRVIGLLEADHLRDVKLLVNRVRPEMIEREDMMSVADVQEVLGLPLLGAIPEDPQVIISTNRGEPLVWKNPNSVSGTAFQECAKRLVDNSTMDPLILKHRVGWTPFSKNSKGQWFFFRCLWFKEYIAGVIHLQTQWRLLTLSLQKTISICKNL